MILGPVGFGGLSFHTARRAQPFSRPVFAGVPGTVPAQVLRDLVLRAAATAARARDAAGPIPTTTAVKKLVKTPGTPALLRGIEALRKAVRDLDEAPAAKPAEKEPKAVPRLPPPSPVLARDAQLLRLLAPASLGALSIHHAKKAYAFWNRGRGR